MALRPHRPAGGAGTLSECRRPQAGPQSEWMELGITAPGTGRFPVTDASLPAPAAQVQVRPARLVCKVRFGLPGRTPGKARGLPAASASLSPASTRSPGRNFLRTGSPHPRKGFHELSRAFNRTARRRSRDFQSLGAFGSATAAGARPQMNTPVHAVLAQADKRDLRTNFMSFIQESVFTRPCGRCKGPRSSVVKKWFSNSL